MRRRHTFITGLGAITSAAPSIQGSWKSLAKNLATFATFEDYPVSRVNDTDLTNCAIDLGLRPYKKELDRAVFFSILAAQQAFENAGSPATENMGVLVGSSRGATEELERAIIAANKGLKIPLKTSPMTTMGSFSSSVSRVIGCNSLNLSLSSACSTGLNAVGMAHKLIQSNMFDRCLAGGAEAPLTKFTMEMLGNLRILSKSNDALYPCRPFHKDRDGLALGEGAAVLCLESERSERTLAEIIGFGSFSDSTTLTGLKADGSSIVKSVERALLDAEIGTGDIDLVVAHGSGTKKGDAAELAAYTELFGQPPSSTREKSTTPLDMRYPRFTSHKWLFGHMLAASSALSIELAIFHLRHNFVPDLPYFNSTSPTRCPKEDDENKLSEPSAFVRRKDLHPSSELKTALIIALGFGGSSSALVIRLPN